MSSTEGYFPHTIYNQMGSTALVASSGAELKVLSGGYLTMKDGSLSLSPVRANSSLVLGVINSGISVITAATSGKAGKVIFTINPPVKAGLCVSLVQNCTFAQIVRGSSVAKKVYFNTTKGLSFTMPNSTKSKGGIVMEMYSISTSVWSIIVARSSAGKMLGGGLCTLSTACT
jgi:hypothetical protein